VQVKFTNHSKIVLVLSILAITALSVLSVILAVGSHNASTAVAGIYVPNINATEVASVIRNATYTPSMIGKTTSFEGALNAEGYIKSSMTTFNLSKRYNKSDFPYIISSSVFLMSNAISAQNALHGILISSANQSSSGPNYSPSTYRFGVTNVTIYTGSTVSIFDASAINSSTEKLLNLPIYQYTSVFAYGNYTVTIVLNGFSSNSIYGQYAIELSKDLINQIGHSSA